MIMPNWQRPLALSILPLWLSACAFTGQVPQPVDTSLDRQPFPAIALGAEMAPPNIVPKIHVAQPPMVWESLRERMALEHHLSNRAVKAELRWLQRNRDYFVRLAPRFSRYQSYIHQAVAERGMPAEIALLPLVESALNPYAMSPDGAHGLWQFMPATGKRFGLQRDWWQDSRRDPVLATKAALDYLSYLHRRFGDWMLAVAAYNTGEGNLQKALRQAQRQHGHPVRDFFALRLPRETRSYVPRLLAVSAVVANPSKFGITLPEVRDRIPFRTVYLKDQYDLSVAAKTLDLDPSEVRSWNPALKQWATPPAGARHAQALNIPVHLASRAQAALDAVPASERLQWHRVTVRQGDTLSSIARRFGTSVATVRSSNNLRSDLIRVNSVLRVPAGGRAFVASAEESRTHTYRVRAGDSMWGIGRKFGVNHKAIMRLNGIGPRDVLRIGQRILVPFDGTGAAGLQAGG